MNIFKYWLIFIILSIRDMISVFWIPIQGKPTSGYIHDPGPPPCRADNNHFSDRADAFLSHVDVLKQDGFFDD